MRSPSPFAAGSCRSETIVAAAALWVLIAVSPAFALDPAQPFGNYLRSHFTTDESLPGTIVDHLQQTPDGFLWMLVNGKGLTRYDGRNFHLFEGTRVVAIAVAPDGDLWLGTAQDLRRMPAERLREFDLSGAVSYHPGEGASSDVRSLRFGDHGELWVGTQDGLFRYENGRFSSVGPRVPIQQIEPLAKGRLLLVSTKGLWEWDGSSVVPVHPPAASPGGPSIETFHVMEDRHGNVWYCGSQGGIRCSGSQCLQLPPYGPVGHGAYRAYEDPEGTVWVVKVEGLFRATTTSLELVGPKMEVRSLYSDRDGALWIGTNGDGLYRFKDRAVRMLTTADGLPNDVIMTVLSAHDGSIWTGANCGGVSRFDGTRFRTYSEKDGLLNTCVWALAEDARHDLWIGTWGGGAFRLHDGSFTQVLAGEIVPSIVAARDGSVWFGTRNGVVRLRDGSLRRYGANDGLSSDFIFRILEDREGRILASTSRGLDRLIGDRFEGFPGVPKTVALATGEDRSGGLFVDLDDQGVLLRIEGNRVDEIPDWHDELTLVETASGEMWFGGMGVYRVPAGSFARPRPRDEPLDYESFTSADGLASTNVSSGNPKMVVAGDGKLWIASPQGVVIVDPERLSRTTERPTLYVRGVTVGRVSSHAPRDLILPPGTSHVELDFAAIEISSPEKIRMQYRLDGVDPEWLDAGPSLRAIYSNIPAGSHAFHLRACSRSGIWDRTGIVYPIRQQPRFYQTRWFLASMVAGGLLVIGSVYRLRVRQVSKQLNALFDERLGERVRVARDLHDTFLQTVQGSKLIADHALKDPKDHVRLLRAVEQLAAWLERATEEGRAALNSLRTSATVNGDLALALRRAIDECRVETRIDAALSVAGNVGELHPIVRDEVYRIGYEAIRNACTHSRAGVLRVSLEHAHDLALRVSDNGVGMDARILESGRERHFGLSGMRERAERIGGRFTIESSPSSGTTITVVVPGRIAYRTRRPGRSRRIASLFSAD